MGTGFFQGSKRSVVKAPTSLIPKCGACGLYKHCTSPKMTPRGKGLKRILIIGEAPGEEDDEQNKPNSGNSGKLLADTLSDLGVDLRRDCVTTHSIICHPKNGASVSIEKIEHCRPNLVKTLADIDPEIIIPLGSMAVQALLGIVYKEDDLGGISRWSGWQIPSQKPNAWICPTFHPSFVLRQEKNPVVGLLFRQHIKKAVGLQGRPWDDVPAFRDEVKLVLDPDRAARAIARFHSAEMIAFDYETTTLKPEHKGASIVCCSMSDGRRTIAYPWIGDAITATGDVLGSPAIKKIASNLKFEERWTRSVFRHGVANWHWDTMVAAHCLDNRPGTTGLKFQSFIHLGEGSYDEHVKQFLKARGTATNRVKEIEIEQLLLYCGLDSLLEFKVAEIQMQMIKGKQA